VANVGCERAGVRAETKPPPTTTDEAGNVTGGLIIEGTDRWLTFELSGRRRVGAWPAMRMMT